MRRVFVAGHSGMVGSAICRLLEQDDEYELVIAERNEVVVIRPAHAFITDQKIDEVYLAAAVGASTQTTRTPRSLYMKI